MDASDNMPTNVNGWCRVPLVHCVPLVRYVALLHLMDRMHRVPLVRPTVSRAPRASRATRTHRAPRASTVQRSRQSDGAGVSDSPEQYYYRLLEIQLRSSGIATLEAQCWNFSSEAVE